MPTHRRQTNTFRRGFGLDKVQSDLPLGGVASLIVHGGILFAALLAWQTTPRIMPEDVIAVDMVSDTPSVLGKNSAPETAQTGVDTATPAPLPQTLPPAPAESLPSPTPEPTSQQPPPEQEAQTAPSAPVLPPPPAKAPSPPPPPPPLVRAAPVKPALAKVAPTARPTALPLPTPPPRPTAQSTPKATPKAVPKVAQKAAPAARTGQRQAAPTAPAEFDLAAASKSATGADSGGRRAPQLASRGQAGRLGKAGGGAQLTGDLEAALRSQIKECWLEPANMADASRLLVVVSIDLGIDGRLLRDPILVTPSSRAGANPSLIVAIDNALRAVRDCAPFTLPPDRYDSWRQVRFNFDPQRMARR